MKAMATCTSPASKSTHTLICKARFYETMASNTMPPPKAPMKLPIRWLMNAMSPSMACQRIPKVSPMKPVTKEATLSQRTPMMVANTKLF